MRALVYICMRVFTYVCVCVCVCLSVSLSACACLDPATVLGCSAYSQLDGVLAGQSRMCLLDICCPAANIKSFLCRLIALSVFVEKLNLSVTYAVSCYLMSHHKFMVMAM